MIDSKWVSQRMEELRGQVAGPRLPELRYGDKCQFCLDAGFDPEKPSQEVCQNCKLIPINNRHYPYTWKRTVPPLSCNDIWRILIPDQRLAWIDEIDRTFGERRSPRTSTEEAHGLVDSNCRRCAGITTIHKLIDAVAIGIKEPKPPKTYHIGQRFVQTNAGYGYGDKCILAQVDDGKVCLISFNDANRWADPVEVQDPHSITESEFKKTWGGAKFELLEKE